jgi:hypothetical protein
MGFQIGAKVTIDGATTTPFLIPPEPNWSSTQAPTPRTADVIVVNRDGQSSIVPGRFAYVLPDSISTGTGSRPATATISHRIHDPEQHPGQRHVRGSRTGRDPPPRPWFTAPCRRPTWWRHLLRADLVRETDRAITSRGSAHWYGSRLVCGRARDASVLACGGK